MEGGMTAFELAREPHWIMDDRRWFARHSDRSHRLRRAHPGEWPVDARNAEWTIVRQVAPGNRVRFPIAEPWFAHAGEAPEAAAWAIFDLTVEAMSTGNRSVTIDEILTRWKRLESAGRA
jgi:hypothetical protein